MRLGFHVGPFYASTSTRRRGKPSFIGSIFGFIWGITILVGLVYFLISLI